MKKNIFWIVTVFVFLFSNLSYSATLGTVKDDNNGNKGDILINTGEVQGKTNDVGIWVNPKEVPELKGEKGDIGKQGIQGITGKDGKNGLNGADGKGLKNQYKAGVEFVIADTKNTSWRIYYNRDFNNNNNETGIKVIIKIGKSYTDKELEKLQKQLKYLAEKVEGRL